MVNKPVDAFNCVVLLGLKVFPKIGILFTFGVNLVLLTLFPVIELYNLNLLLYFQDQLFCKNND